MWVAFLHTKWLDHFMKSSADVLPRYFTFFAMHLISEIKDKDDF